MTPPDPSAVFEEPWQAQAFALTVHLHAVGAFSWSQWTAALAEAISVAEDSSEKKYGTPYYEAWLAALESLSENLGLFTGEDLARRMADWSRAFREAPHGEAVELKSP